VYIDIQDVLSADEEFLPKAYALYQNYPNPFNPTTTISFDLPKDVLVEITIFDMLGRHVSTLVNKNIMAGRHHIKWSGTNNLGAPVSAGLYFYRLNAGTNSATKKMIFMK
jgi:flagellar hook assembly protein FlgD